MQPALPVITIVSCLLFLQLVTVVIGLASNLAPSFVQGRINVWLAPYQVATGQDYVMLPLELTHAGLIDAPVIVEVEWDQSGEWLAFPLPSINPQPSLTRNPTDGSRSRWPNLARLFAWIAQEQPDAEVLSRFARQLALYANSLNPQQTLTGLRLIQPHVVSFDEDLLVSQGKADLIEQDLHGNVLYEVQVLRETDGTVRVLPLQEPMMMSPRKTSSGGQP